MALDGFTLVAVLLLLAALAVVALAGRAAFSRESIVERRLRPAPDVAERVASTGWSGGGLAAGLAAIAKVAQPVKQEELARLRLMVSRAGFRGERAREAFLASKIVLALAFGVAFLWVNSTRARPIEPAFLLTVGAFALGYYVPSLWLSARVRARQLALERGLPDALDLLVTCVEAGLGLDAALQRVSKEVHLAWPLLGEELQLTFLEIKAGIARAEAFRRLAHRTGVSELKSLAATLTQTEIFGTSVGLALRVQAEGIRVRRMQRAEERAGYVSVKMSMPLVFCILPTLFAFVIGPAVLKVAGALLPALGRHP